MHRVQGRHPSGGLVGDPVSKFDLFWSDTSKVTVTQKPELTI